MSIVVNENVRLIYGRRDECQGWFVRFNEITNREVTYHDVEENLADSKDMSVESAIEWTCEAMNCKPKDVTVIDNRPEHAKPH